MSSSFNWERAPTRKGSQVTTSCDVTSARDSCSWRHEGRTQLRNREQHNNSGHLAVVTGSNACAVRRASHFLPSALLTRAWRSGGSEAARRTANCLLSAHLWSSSCVTSRPRHKWNKTRARKQLKTVQKLEKKHDISANIFCDVFAQIVAEFCWENDGGFHNLKPASARIEGVAIGDCNQRKRQLTLVSAPIASL